MATKARKTPSPRRKSAGPRAGKSAARAAGHDDNQLAAAIRDSATQIWLAGVGAFAKARDERNRVFQALVREGRGIQLRTRAMAEERIGEVAGRVTEVRDRATESWDKLEQVFEDRVSRALARLGVPTHKDVKALIKRVDELTASLNAMGSAAAAGPASAAPEAGAAKKTAAKKTAARKTAARKAAAGKTAAGKTAARKAAGKSGAKKAAVKRTRALKSAASGAAQAAAAGATSA
ncbi:MAG TPA: phasin family protein [Burkholderiaceae bacterium]